MIKKDLLLPALLGLGLYSHDKNLCLNSNTTMLLLLYILFEDHKHIEDIERILYPQPAPCGCAPVAPFTAPVCAPVQVYSQPRFYDTECCSGAYRRYDVPYYNPRPTNNCGCGCNNHCGGF